MLIIRKTITAFHSTAFIIATSMLIGCSTTVINQEAPEELVGGYQDGNQIDLKIGIVVTNEFRNTTIVEESPFYKKTIFLGEALALNTENLGEILFSDITVANSTELVVNSDIDAVLIPKVIFTDQSSAMQMTIIAKVEWTMNDLNGNNIWVDTITGKGSEPAGNSSTEHDQTEKRIKKLMKDLFMKSHKAISSSPEIREYAKNH